MQQISKVLKKNKTEESKSSKPIIDQDKSDDKKNIDLVFLIDNCITNKFFYEALKEAFNSISKERISKYPTKKFRFGVIMYNDLAFSRESNIHHLNG